MSTLKEICAQLKSCNFQCDGGDLKNNAAFVELEKIAQLEADTHKISKKIGLNPEVP